MTEPVPKKPERRPRYHGKNPRTFHEKYKEHQPEHYAEDVAKVIAGGKTPAGMHRPIMVPEILEVLTLRPGDVALDCTLGYGGHARELLARVQPGGRLIGLDVDSIELPKTKARINAMGFPAESIVVARMNFAGLPGFLAEAAPEGVDVLLADLGLSSMQIDNPTRGFTYKEDGPLDMRMNPERGQPASAFLSTLNEASLTRILSENADEPLAAEISAAILRTHAVTPLHSTRSLAAIVITVFERFSRHSRTTADDTIRRVFQAIRIAVNDEFGALDALLRALPSSLKPGGRVAILSFHSGEDRRVKAAFKTGLENKTYAAISHEVIRASGEERRANPRSSSAKLRFAIRSNSS